LTTSKNVWGYQKLNNGGANGSELEPTYLLLQAIRLCLQRIVVTWIILSLNTFMAVKKLQSQV